MEISSNCFKNVAAKEHLQVFCIPGTRPSASPASDHLLLTSLVGNMIIIISQLRKARPGEGKAAPSLVCRAARAGWLSRLLV